MNEKNNQSYIFFMYTRMKSRIYHSTNIIINAKINAEFITNRGGSQNLALDGHI